MAYDKTTWENGETAITAKRLNNIESGIADKAEQGPKGDKGAKGDQGEQGPAGEDGSDGFPPESDWEDLVSRVEALESE